MAFDVFFLQGKNWTFSLTFVLLGTLLNDGLLPEFDRQGIDRLEQGFIVGSRFWF